MQDDPTYPYGYGFCQCGCGEDAPIATRTNRKNGWVAGEPLRYINGHNRRKTPHAYEVDPETGCWNWVRAKNSRGYGRMKLGGEVFLAHRWYYEQNVGPIPEGLQVDHICNNKPCVNPDHLRVVTHAQNLRRGKNTKLTADLVRQIRRADGTDSEIGRRFGISSTHVSHIKTRRYWADIK